MTSDLHTLLMALYVEINDHVVPACRDHGRRPCLTEAELLTLAAAQVLLGIDTEARWIRFAYCRLGHLFDLSDSEAARDRAISALDEPLLIREESISDRMVVNGD